MAEIYKFTDSDLQDEVFGLIREMRAAGKRVVDVDCAIARKLGISHYSAHRMYVAWYVQIKGNERRLTKLLKGNM